MSKDVDIIVIGAGAAGLTAAARLGKAGLTVTILEARERCGGRMFTLRDPVCDTAVELGAEFIHGQPPEIWKLIDKNRIRTTEADGDNWCRGNGRLRPCDFFSEVDQVLQKMNDRKGDQSFRNFLRSLKLPSTPKQNEAKRWATGYVSGFNAADPARVGVHWLVKEMRAEEKIEGDRAFRAENGYADLLTILLREAREAGVMIRNNMVVETISWSRRRVQVRARTAKEIVNFSTPKVLIAVPLGVLQAGSKQKGAIQFVPDLPQKKKDAIKNIAMGEVIRVTLRFRECFWEGLPRNRKKGSKSMAGMSFLLSHDRWFPTWWTRSPQKLPLLVGWAPFRCAERLSFQSKSFVVEQSLQALHRLMGVSVRELETLLESAYYHDWQADPFSRGAYSYGKVGGDGAAQALARPVDSILFFAGEATDARGVSGTVQAAIASGQRAAAEILETIIPKKTSRRHR